MQNLFYSIIDISVASVWLILAVVILRAVLQKAPKWIRNIMWSLVAVRLVFPFKIESKIGVVPQLDINEIGTPKITATETPPTAAITEAPVITATPSGVSVAEILSIVWLVGIAAMMVYLIISYVKLKKRVDISIILDSRYRICDSIQTPFIFGVIKPKVYLPSVIGEEQLQYVIEHENSHLMRGDHIWKLLGFILLSVHWFNPFVWLAYFLFCKDIELSCDERVISGKDADYKRQYSAALLACSAPQKAFSTCPVAFGEISVKSRIANVVKYKKPAVILVLVSLVVTASLLLLFLRAPFVSAQNNEVIPHNTNNSNIGSVPTQTENEEKESDDIILEIPSTEIIGETHVTETKCTHTYKNTKFEGDCFTEGYTKHECTKCGFVYMDGYNRGRHDYGKYNCLECGMVDPNYALYGFRAWVKEFGTEAQNFYTYAVRSGDGVYGVQRHILLEEYCVLTYDNTVTQEHIYITFYDTSYCTVYYEWGKYSGTAEVKNSGVNSSTGIVFDDFTGDDAARIEFTEHYKDNIETVMRGIENNIVKAKMGIMLNLLGFPKY